MRIDRKEIEGMEVLKELIEYIKSLDEFDPKIFKTITGWNVDDLLAHRAGIGGRV